jgi:hypothetical protein
MTQKGLFWWWWWWSWIPDRQFQMKKFETLFGSCWVEFVLCICILTLKVCWLLAEVYAIVGNLLAHIIFSLLNYHVWPRSIR